MLRDGFVFKGDKTESTTRICVWVLNDLDIFDNSKLAEIARELVFIEVIVESANKYFITSATATRSAFTLPVRLLALPITAFVLLTVATTAAAASLFAIASAALVVVVVIATLLHQKGVCGLVAVTQANLYVAAANCMAIGLQHNTIKRLALVLVVAVNFESDKGKASRAT